MCNTHEYVYTRVAYIRAYVRTYRQTQNRQTSGQAAINGKPYATLRQITTCYNTLHDVAPHYFTWNVIANNNNNNNNNKKNKNDCGIHC